MMNWFHIIFIKPIIVFGVYLAKAKTGFFSPPLSAPILIIHVAMKIQKVRNYIHPCYFLKSKYLEHSNSDPLNMEVCESEPEI